ncbi:TPA: hypothetical protein QDB21_005620 [Burkholderia vietnamiensis]|nr:hypothetical protein [Burkholderia vietnamiensis]
MNADQIAFNKRYIRDAKARIAELYAEMANPRSRAAKNRGRAAVIAQHQEAIAGCLKRLFDAGVIEV